MISYIVAVVVFLVMYYLIDLAYIYSKKSKRKFIEQSLEEILKGLERKRFDRAKQNNSQGVS